MRITLALLAGTIGEDMLEFRLAGHADLCPQVSGFELAARTQLVVSLSLIVLSALELSGSSGAVPLLWAGALGLFQWAFSPWFDKSDMANVRPASLKPIALSRVGGHRLGVNQRSALRRV